jgi:hypothetical protein
MAKGQTVAIWIILVVVMAAAAGVIVIAVQNNKREQQLSPVQDAAVNYNNSAPKQAKQAVTMGRPSMRAGLNPMNRVNSQPLQNMQAPQMQQGVPHNMKAPQMQQGMPHNMQAHQMQQGVPHNMQAHQMQQGVPHNMQAPQMQQGKNIQRERYDTALVNSYLEQGNQLPPSFVDSSYKNNVGMTTFAPLPGPAHVMSTTPPNYPPRSGGGALFIPSQSPQAQMPAQQMSVSHSFPSTIDSKLQDLSTISAVGTSYEKAAIGTSMSNFSGAAYFQDPATMTPNTYADGLGLDSYMPDVSNATPDGLDPQTGLPVFSTASLLRSNRLSSHGLNGYLRPQMDDTQGYKHTVGKRLQICRYNDCDLDKRRNQFNASRLNSGGEDPVLFNVTDFMYLP